MMTVVHGLAGAALGSHAADRRAAFLAGSAAHLLGDAVPHGVVSPRLDLVLTATAAVAVLLLKGPQSREAAGFAGGALPDAEHVPDLFGLFRLPIRLFPSHWRVLHGRESARLWPEFVLMAFAAGLIAADRQGRRPLFQSAGEARTLRHWRAAVRRRPA